MLMQESARSDSIVADQPLVGDFCNTIEGKPDLTLILLEDRV
jgi:hypothetical protein